MSVFPVAERFKLSSSDSKTFRHPISQLLPDMYNQIGRLGALIVRRSGRMFAFILRFKNLPTSDFLILFFRHASLRGWVYVFPIRRCGRDITSDLWCKSFPVSDMFSSHVRSNIYTGTVYCFSIVIFRWELSPSSCRFLKVAKVSAVGVPTNRWQLRKPDRHRSAILAV